MIDIDALILKTNEISDQLLRLKNEMQKKDMNAEELETIQTLSKAYPIRGHYLQSVNDYIRRLYITMLCTLINKEYDMDRRQTQLIFLGRTVASCEHEVNLTPYVTNALNINLDDISEFVENIKGEGAVAFSVDALTLCFLEGEADEDVLKLSVGYISLLNLDSATIADVCGIVKAILSQSAEGLLGIKNLDVNTFTGYIKDMPEGYIARRYQSCKNIRSKLIIVNEKISNLKQIMNLDEFKTKNIKFYNCVFSNIKGIQGTRQFAAFERCLFENVCVPRKEGGWSNSKEVEEDFSLINISNCSFAECRFHQCKVSKNLICAQNGLVYNCKIENCEGVDLLRSFLIEIESGKITNTNLIKCNMMTKRDRNGQTLGGIVLLKQGEIANCGFTDCKAYGVTDYGRYNVFIMYIVKLVNSRICNTTFKNCSCSNETVTDQTVKSYILGLEDSNDRNVHFINCTSKQYRYGDLQGSDNIGKI